MYPRDLLYLRAEHRKYTNVESRHRMRGAWDVYAPDQAEIKENNDAEWDIQQEEMLVTTLEQSGWNIHVASNAEQARKHHEKHRTLVGLAVLDPSRKVDHAIEELSDIDQNLKWLALVPSKMLDDPRTRLLITNHFRDYHTLPLDLERLRYYLGHAFGMAKLSCSGTDELDRDRVEIREEEMVGTCRAMQEVFQTIRKIAKTDAPVLISGETGTGKELAAAAIHERSHRSKGPFITVNCGALPPTLIQSELFGYEKGAFTGAYKRKTGYIEYANNGIIFLDEIGDLPLDLQTNLLHFLQEGAFNRVGGADEISVDVRVIAATNVDLEQAVKEGAFREDLFYRINVLRLHMPPLTERTGDIELLANYFFKKFSEEHQTPVKGFTRDALRLMNRHTWPGNVREMINRIRRAIVMCDNRLLRPIDLGLEQRVSERHLATLEEARAEAEKRTILNSLRYAGDNVSQAAQQLEISRQTMYRLMERYEIAPHKDDAVA